MIFLIHPYPALIFTKILKWSLNITTYWLIRKKQEFSKLLFFRNANILSLSSNSTCYFTWSISSQYKDPLSTPCVLFLGLQESLWKYLAIFFCFMLKRKSGNQFSLSRPNLKKPFHFGPQAHIFGDFSLKTPQAFKMISIQNRPQLLMGRKNLLLFATFFKKLHINMCYSWLIYYDHQSS